MKSAYPQIKIHLASYPYLGGTFTTDGKTFFIGNCSYCTLPFGLRSAVYVFSRLLRPVTEYLRRFFQILVYIDDLFFILGTDFKQACLFRDFILFVLENLGIGLSQKNCSDVIQAVTWIGFRVDTTTSTFTASKSRILKICDTLDAV